MSENKGNRKKNQPENQGDTNLAELASAITMIKPEDLPAIPESLPLIELRNNVCFPRTLLPIFVGRTRSRLLVDDLTPGENLVAIVAQKNPNVEKPTQRGLYRIGTLARVHRVLRFGDRITMVTEGIARIRITDFAQTTPYYRVEAEYHPEPDADLSQPPLQTKVDVLRKMAQNYFQLNPNSDYPFSETTGFDSLFLVNMLAQHAHIPVSKKQALLEANSYDKRIDKLLDHFAREIQSLKLQQEIQERTQKELEKQQREFILQQQLRTIQDELGDNPSTGEIEKIKKQGAKLKLNKEAREAFDREVGRLEQMNPMAPDFAIQLAYLQLFIELPWGVYSKDNHDLQYAQECLDEDHFGLEKVKERIMEYLAVLKLKNDLKSPIICLYGPPGVGKTSLGKSIAKALGRQYARISLGGMHDESEIRGHRRTYIGAMPGRIIQNLRKVKTANPVFILDEIDKITSNMMGDPASALLEVLDPEQNSSFYDNYLEVEFDLSNVLFITTANDLSTISPPLRDRMEIIELTGYVTEEKIAIAERHLIPKRLEAHGVKKEQFNISSELIGKAIERYTRESGVRKLDQVMAKLIRQQAKRIANEEEYSATLTEEDLTERLGQPVFSPEQYRARREVGVAVGMAWTQVGGEILYVESSIAPGKGRLTITGNLGDIMKESATIALQIVRSRAENFSISRTAFEEYDVHLHVPEGAIPKDGPSAGVTMVTSLLSTYTRIVPQQGIAMTGEVTLTGRVLPVGGIKEKILAAKRASLEHIILPAENEKDIADIKAEYIEGLTFSYVNTVDDLARIVFPSR